MYFFYWYDLDIIDELEEINKNNFTPKSQIKNNNYKEHHPPISPLISPKQRKINNIDDIDNITQNLDTKFIIDEAETLLNDNQTENEINESNITPRTPVNSQRQNHFIRNHIVINK